MSRNRTALRTQKRKCQFASKGDPFSRPRICKYNFGRTWLIILDALFVRRRMQRQSREALFRAKHILKKSLKDFGNSRMGGSLAARTGHKSNLLNSFVFLPIRHHS